MYDIFLIKKIAIGIIISIVWIYISMRLWNCKPLIGKGTVNINIPILMTIYSRILPLLVIYVIWLFFALPVFDYFALDKYQSTEGVLKGISASNYLGRGFLGEYTIKLNQKTYRVPKKLLPHINLKKDIRYKIQYYKHCKLVYNIERLP